MARFTVTVDPTRHPPIACVDPDGQPVSSVSDFLRLLDLRGRSVYTQRAYALGMAHFFEWLHENDIAVDAVTHAIIGRYIEAYAHGAKGGACPPNSDHAGQIDRTTRTRFPALERQPSTINHRLSVLASYYAFRITQDTERGSGPGHGRENPVISGAGAGQRRHGMTGRDAPARRRTHDFRRRVSAEIPPRLDAAIIEQVIAAAHSWRDTGILTLLCRTGQRIGDWRSDADRHGVLGMTLADVDARSHTIIVRLKGARDEHRVPVTDDFWPLYQHYLTDERPSTASTSAPWVSFRRGHGTPLSYQAFESSLRAIGRRLGMRLHAHLFRHTLAQAVLETTGNLKVTQELLGHAHLSTTAEQYARVDQQALVEAVAAAKRTFDAAIDRVGTGGNTDAAVQRYVFAYDARTIEELDQIAVSHPVNGERR